MTWPLVGRKADLDHVCALVTGGTGVALVGAAGVGKSRLLQGLATASSERGAAVVWAVASSASHDIAFAPFVELLPEQPTGDRLAMLAAARAALEQRRTEHGLVILVDDAHHLDPASLGFLIGVVSAGAATVAMTVRSGEAMPADLTRLWTNGVIHRIDVGPLDHDATTELIGTVLGATTAELDDELWQLARGNPLVLHEILEGAATLERGDDGLWQATDGLAVSARLSDLVASRLNELSESTRDALAVLALGEPLSATLATAAVGETDDLEVRGLAHWVESGGERQLVTAHPLYGEVMAANLTTTHRRRTLERLVSAGIDTPNRSDRLRAANWQHELGTVLSVDLALDGAAETLARHDPAAAEAILESLDAGDPRVALLLGRCLAYQQRLDEAHAVLADVTTDDPELSAELVSARAHILAFGLGDIDGARRLLADGASAAGSPTARARLLNERGVISAIRGDFSDARAASEGVLAGPEVDAPALGAAYVGLTLAVAITGDIDRLDEVIDDALGVADECRDVLPMARDQIGIAYVCGLFAAGRLDEAVRRCQAALDDPTRGDAVRLTWLSTTGVVMGIAGRYRTAATMAAAAIDLCEVADPFQLEHQARGVAAWVRGESGDSQAGSTLTPVPMPVVEPRIGVWVGRGRVWSTLAAGGSVDDAVATAVETGRAALAGEHHAWAAFCFHDAVRLGRPEASVDQLGEIAKSVRGAELVTEMYEHAVQLRSGDVDGLAAVAQRFVDFGALPYAAETWAQVVRLAESDRPTLAARACLRSVAIEAACEGLATVAITDRPTALTQREGEIALDAAAGLTSAAIAEQRFISVRTVDNHLRTVYRKLGVHSRDELAELVSPAG